MLRVATITDTGYTVDEWKLKFQPLEYSIDEGKVNRMQIIVESINK